MLCGSAQMIKTANGIRCWVGGCAKQAFAAAGLYALERHVSDCVEDNRRALDFGRACGDARRDIGTGNRPFEHRCL